MKKLIYKVLINNININKNNKLKTKQYSNIKTSKYTNTFNLH